MDLAEILSRAERILGNTLATPVRLGNAQRLSESGRHRLLIRCAIESPPTGSIPTSVMIKQAAGEDYDPDDPRSRAALGLFRGWAGLEFLNALTGDSSVCPRFYGGDRAAGFFVMEDVAAEAAAEDLDHVLTCGSQQRAEKSLLLLARTLGRMHASTAGHAEQYQRIRDALGPGDRQRRMGLAQHVRQSAAAVAESCRQLGVKVAERFADDAGAVAAVMAEPGPFLAFTHADPCPDNCLLVKDRLYLIDYEFASFRHALLDGVYGRLRFPTCFCVRDIPEAVVATMEAAYRAELANGCPAAQDDGQYFRAVADAAAYWMLQNLSALLPRAMEYEQPMGTATNRQRLLIRLMAFDQVASRAGHVEALRQTLRHLLDTLRERWQGTSSGQASMSVYDAFGQSGEPSAEQIGEFVAALNAKQVDRVGQQLEQCPALARAKVADEDQTPVLFVAVQTNDPQLVALLVAKGADWRITTRAGWTVLAKACAESTPAVVEPLLAHGADLNARDMWGSLPIYGAVGNATMLNFLLARGARVDLKTAFDLKQLDVARHLLSENPSAARFRFGTGLSLLHDQGRSGGGERDNFAALRLLLEHGADVNALTNWGATPLHVAAFNGHADTVHFLLDNGAAVNPKDEHGNTPYALAMQARHSSCAQILLHHGGSL